MTEQRALEGFEGLLAENPKARLQERFIIPPFSILDTRQGYWLNRRRHWIALGIKSEIGRGDNLTWGDSDQIRDINYYSKLKKIQEEQLKNPEALANPEELNASVDVNVTSGTSTFDPVLCELIYKWFSPSGGVVLDPFAGGSVRGIVAHMLGLEYHGIDLNEPQIEANREQAEEIIPDNPPHWYVGDSNKMSDILPYSVSPYFDLLFTCPPYHDLEKYTDDEDDLSNMSWPTFTELYWDIIAKAIPKLKPNRFACLVVGEIRDKVGGYRGLVPYTIQAFTQNGMRYYNEMVLITAIGSLPVRIGGSFGSFRKIGRTHQNVLVFYKGDIARIPRNFKEIETGLP